MFGEITERAREAGLISSKVYRIEEGSNEILFVSESRSDDNLHEFGGRFSEIAVAKSEDWEDVAPKRT